MKQICITRIRQDQNLQTLGHASVYDDEKRIFDFVTLEPPWKNNKTDISCIPEGKYWVEKFSSPEHGLVFLFNNVKGRSMVEIHAGNYFNNTRGCLLPGIGFTDINKDGLLDVHTSGRTLDKLFLLMPERFVITINSI